VLQKSGLRLEEAPVGAVPKGAERLWRVRVVAGQALVHDYVWNSEEHARHFLASLGDSTTAQILAPEHRAAAVAPDHAPSEGTGAPGRDTNERCRIYVAISARHQLKGVSARDWSDIVRHLVELAHGATHSLRGSREALQAAGIEPPYLRLRAGNHLLICDANPAVGAVTVLHVLPTVEETKPQASVA
jgi:hypothetical protein